jgi:hypothetical protein
VLVLFLIWSHLSILILYSACVFLFCFIFHPRPFVSLSSPLSLSLSLSTDVHAFFSSSSCASSYFFFLSFFDLECPSMICLQYIYTDILLYPLLFFSFVCV